MTIGCESSVPNGLRNGTASLLGADSKLERYSQAGRRRRQRFLPCDESLFQRIAESARRGGHDIRRAKGGTNYGISTALTRIVTAILRDEHAVLLVSTAIPETMHLGQVTLSVLAIVGREGVHRLLPLQLSDEETLALRRAADLIKR